MPVHIFLEHIPSPENFLVKQTAGCIERRSICGRTVGLAANPILAKRRKFYGVSAAWIYLHEPDH